MSRMNRDRPFRFRKTTFWLTVICFVLTLFANSGCASWQRKKIFVARHFTPDQVDQSARKARLERWYNPSGQAIGMKRLSPVQPAIGRLVILYGNASWTASCAHYVNDIQKAAALDVYILEYPGYADRPGTPSEASAFRAADDALAALDAATNQPVYLLGESLGTGVASHLAGTHPDQIAGIILLSPFNRLTGVAQYQVRYLPAWLLLVDRFPSEVYLRNYHGPVGITVDGQDHVVPEKFGLKLYNGYAGPKRLWNFPAGRHIAIGEPPVQFWTEALNFWQTNRITMK